MMATSQQKHPVRRRAAHGRLALGSPMACFLLIFGLAPLSVLLLYSFWTDGFFTIEHRFTLANYAALFHGQIGSTYLQVLRRTFTLAIIVSAVALLIGFPTAYWIARYVKRFQMVIVFLLFLPLMTSYLVKIYAWRLLLGEKGLINFGLQHVGITHRPLGFLLFNLFAVGIGLMSAVLPFMILPLYVSLERIPERLYDAATDLGAGPMRTFWRVTLPLAQRGMLAGVSFVFVICVGDFVASTLLGGTSGTLAGVVIYSSFGIADDWPLGTAMAFFLLLVVFGTLTLFAWLIRRHGHDVAFEADLSR